MKSADPLVHRYLNEFRNGLRHLDEAERNELCLELESNIHEAMGAGRPLTDVLERLGPADRLARAYAAELLLANPGGGGLGRGIRRTLTGAGLLAGTSLLSLMVVPLLATLGYGFGASGLLVIVSGFFSFAFPGMIQVPAGFDMPLPLVSALVLVLGLLITGIGWGAVLLLRKYLAFTSAMLRRSVAG